MVGKNSGLCRLAVSARGQGLWWCIIHTYQHSRTDPLIFSLPLSLPLTPLSTDTPKQQLQQSAGPAGFSSPLYSSRETPALTVHGREQRRSFMEYSLRSIWPADCWARRWVSVHPTRYGVHASADSAALQMLLPGSAHPSPLPSPLSHLLHLLSLFWII